MCAQNIEFIYIVAYFIFIIFGKHNFVAVTRSPQNLGHTVMCYITFSFNKVK